MQVVLLWHMHQPDYRVDGRFLRPWVYLHALAGYTEMAAELESSPSMRAVVNLTPVLIDQLDDYVRRFRHWQQQARPIGDPLLDALAETPAAGPGRAEIVRTCLPVANSLRASRHPRYRSLADAAACHDPETLPEPLFTDLLAWFHLSWFGGSTRRHDRRASEFLDRDRPFDRKACHALLETIAETVARVLPRWRALANEDRVELATSPYYHPLCPLLLDFGSARDRAPAVALPSALYPGGEARLRWHLGEGLARFESLIGHRASGCWPPEAALSEAALHEIADAGFEWTASSRSVLDEDSHRLFRHPASGIHCAFRDDGLSDRIGFEYQHWRPADAIRDLVQHLESIAREPGCELVLIALDGENPWEYYPDEGSGFLQGLYAALGSHAVLRPATMRDCVRELAATATPLPPLRAGSWVHGELLTWVGHPEKNRAWEMLIEAKRCFDRNGRIDRAIEHRLGACEGSDWFWWPGVHNPGPAVAQFDALFRAQLSALYRALQLPPPDSLAQSFASGVTHDVAAGGTMQPSS